MEQAMQGERWNIMGNTNLPSTSLYDYFHGLSIQVMIMIRQNPHNIATYDIQGLGLQHVASTELYGLYPPVTVNCSTDFSSIENREFNLRLKMINWDHQDGGHGIVEAMWSGDLSCDQILELLQDHRINLIWQHQFTYHSDLQDEDYSDYQDDIEEEEEVAFQENYDNQEMEDVQETHDNPEIEGLQETHDNQEMEEVQGTRDNQEIEGVPNNPEENDTQEPLVTINVTLPSGEELQIRVFESVENGEVENPDRGAPPAAKSAVEGLPTVTVCQNEVDSGAAQCLVCTEMVAVGESARQLPCKHMFHSHCIVQWLSIRNSCPTCRYELPTDDPQYELQSRRQNNRDM